MCNFTYVCLSNPHLSTFINANVSKHYNCIFKNPIILSILYQFQARVTATKSALLIENNFSVEMLTVLYLVQTGDLH